ncbi:MAG: ABC transporter permease [Candidatus Aminicenantes bacterium]|nr:ABC transporter permease [Candidatus Aminicenantes bacterium]
MFATIVRKEIHNHILSFRFLVTALLLLIVIPATVLVLTNDYVRQLDDYSRRQVEIEHYLQRYAHFNRLGNIITPTQPPVPFMTMVRGLSADVDMSSFRNDPLPIVFPFLDLTFIVAILFSLAALVFSYDSVSGEREDGTLKLMLANGVPRAKILLGKIVGSTATLLIPFLISTIAGLFIVLLNPRVGWKGADFGALAVLLVGVLLYIGLFVTLGTLISARHRSSAASIMTSLFVWVLMVLVIPNLSPYAASFFRPAPSRLKIEREVFRLTQDERDVLGRQLAKAKTDVVLKGRPLLSGVERMSEKDVADAIRKDPEFAAAYSLYRKASQEGWDEANARQSAKAEVLQKELDRREKAQTKLAVELSMASPLADFTYLATDLSNTGMRNQRRFDTLRQGWWRIYGDYQDRRLEELKKANPTADAWNIAADVRDMPRFRYTEESLAARLKGILAPLAVLMIMTVGLFIGAFVSFIRYDAR